jgi:hypothetical protein
LNSSDQRIEIIFSESLLWTAPEHLRQKHPELQGSQKGDVYRSTIKNIKSMEFFSMNFDFLFSFSIVLQEIITRSGPFETVKVIGIDGITSVLSLDPQFIIQQLKIGGMSPYRPNVEQHECTPELFELLIQCWDEVPSNRPSFAAIKQQLKKITKFEKLIKVKTIKY